MSLLNIEENIKKDFTVGDFYEVFISNGGMTGTLEDNAKKVFKPGVTLDDIMCDMKSTSINEFNSLFKYPISKWIGMWRLKKFLRKWIRKKYLSGHNKPYCEIRNIRVGLASWPTNVIIISVYNGEVIEGATEACFWFLFKRK